MGSVNGVLLPPPSVLVAEENGPGVQRPGLDELQVDPVPQVLEQRLAAAQHNRVDNDVVFVDQPEPGEGFGRFEPPVSSRSLPGCSLSAVSSSARFSLITRVFQAAFSRVLEKTIFGVARQTGADSRSCSSVDIDSACGQKLDIMSHVTRP
jgi:hypothetical protein